jgi:hypothetical protein
MEQEIINNVIGVLKKHRFTLEDEKVLQMEISNKLTVAGIPFFRERRLDPRNIVDFLVWPSIAIEVKIGGSKMSIYKQCERYCGFNEVKAIILLTNKSVLLPEEIKGKQAHVINLSESWL